MKRLVLVSLVACLAVTGCSKDPQDDYCQEVEEHQVALSDIAASQDSSALFDALDTYDDLAAKAGAAVGAAPRSTVDTGLGGHHPVRLLDAAAARIWAGESEIALLVGAEAQASVSLLGKAGVDPVGEGWAQSNVRYYLYAYLYVVFAVDAVYLFLWATVVELYAWPTVLAMAVFLGILAVGLLHVWRAGVLRWR